MDLTAIFYAAKSWNEGLAGLIYVPGPETFLVTPPAEWVAWAEADGQPEPLLTPYLYPPLWAALFAPLTQVFGAQAFFNGTLLVLIASTLWMVWLSWRFVQPIQISTLGWALASFALLFATAPGFMSYWLGQPQVLVSAVTLAAFVALANGRDLTAGSLLALAAAAKLSPALLVILFVMEGRWRALAAFAVVGLGLAGVSVALTGWALHAELLAKLGEVEAHILISRIIVSAELWLYHFAEFFAGRQDWAVVTPFMVDEPAWITWVVRAGLVAGTIAIWATTRDITTRLRIWARLFALLILTLLANPLGWVHYLILPLVMLPGLYEIMPRRGATYTLVGTGFLLSMPVFTILRDKVVADFTQVLIYAGVSIALLILVLIRARTEANP